MPDRLRILEDEEIEALYGIPRFTPEERHEYFSLAPRERAALEQLHSIKSRLFFLLQLGYFKARHQFFIFGLGQAHSPPAIEQDAAYLCERYFPDFELGELEITKVTRPWASAPDSGSMPVSELRRGHAGRAPEESTAGGPGLQQTRLHLPRTDAVSG